MRYMFVCVSSEAKSVHPMLKPYLWGTSHLFAPAECFLVSSLRNLRSASLIEYHNFLHLHSPFFADFFFRFISFTLFSLKSAHRVFFTDSVCWLSLFTFKDTPHNWVQPSCVIPAGQKFREKVQFKRIVRTRNKPRYSKLFLSASAIISSGDSPSMRFKSASASGRMRHASV